MGNNISNLRSEKNKSVGVTVYVYRKIDILRIYKEKDLAALKNGTSKT